MRLILPFERRPPVIAYQFHAFPFGTLFPHPEYLPEFLTQYINLFYDCDDPHGLDFDTGFWFHDAAYFDRQQLAVSADDGRRGRPDRDGQTGARRGILCNRGLQRPVSAQPGSLSEV